jgi:hypothetical protein
MDPDGRVLTGAEHEHRVLDADGVQQDARLVLGDLALAGRRLDPGDPNALRGPWGGVITADGREAEIATPPVPLAPGAALQLEGYLQAGAAALMAALPDGFRLDGYSTHLSVGCDDAVVVRAARLYATRLAPAMMLMLDRPASPGLLVRPRAARLELGGEFVAGPSFRAAAWFAIATGLACGRAVRDRRLRRTLPAGRGWNVETARGRAGWYVDRRAFGCDLYAEGRHAVLGRGRRRVTAQDLLERTWSVARPLVAEQIAPDELGAVDRMVAGDAPLPLEGAPVTGAEVPAPKPGPHGELLTVRERPGFRVEAVVATWHVAVFALTGADGRRVYRPVRAERLAAFLAEVDDGRLDAVVKARLAAAQSGTTLESLDQVQRTSVT